MANLVIDIGNTFVKIAIFNFDELSWVKSYADVNQQVAVLAHHVNQLMDDKFRSLEGVIFNVSP